MKRALIIGGVALALMSVLCVGLVALVLVVTPVRADLSLALSRVRDRAESLWNEQRDERVGAQETRSQINNETGILVAQVVEDSPAAEAGVRRGDILLAVDGQPVNRLSELRNVLQEYQAGDEVSLLVHRGDEQLTLTATLIVAESSGQDEESAGTLLGILSCEVDNNREQRGQPDSNPFDEDLPEEWALQTKPGLVITQVVDGGPADQAGLRRGETILSVDGVAVDNHTTFTDTLAGHQPGDSLTLEVAGIDGETREITVELGEHPEYEGEAYLGVRLRASRMRLNPEQNPFPMPEIPDGQLPDGHPPVPGMPFFEGQLEPGALIQEVVEESPAEQAGLHPGQIILAVEGEEITTSDDLAEAVAAREPGDQVVLSVLTLATGETSEFQVTLGENPDQAGAAWLGIRYVFLDLQTEPAPEEQPGG